MQRRNLFAWTLAALVATTFSVRADPTEPPRARVPVTFDYERFPRNYFLFPIKPGQTNYLAGNMGELRPNHFHGGLDIKTDQRTGLPVLATAEGFVYRVRVAEGGYGNAVYVQHPNGLRSVYGHLESFYPALAQYVRGEQYRQERFEVDLSPPPAAFALRRGQELGKSGNSGGSGGPHLHFEIRDSSEAVLNPLRFGFSEVRDRVAPVFRRFALRPLAADARLEGVFDDFEAVPVRRGNQYAYQTPIEVAGTVGLEIDVYDQHDNSSNQNGVQCVEVKLDGQEVYYHRLERFTFAQSHDINVHVNYAVWQEKNVRYQRCYLADGNHLDIYRTGKQGGQLHVDDTRDHTLEVTCWDSDQNAATLTLTLRGRRPDGVIAPTVDPRQPPRLSHERYGNILRLTARNLPVQSRPAVVYAGQDAYVLPATYSRNDATVFLYDLRGGLPDSVDVDGQKLVLPYRAALFPGGERTYQAPGLQLSFPAGSLFDTLYLTARNDGKTLEIGPSTEPIEGSVEVNWRPDQPADPAKTAVYALSGRGGRAYQGGEWQPDGTVRFRTRRMGRFVLATDDTPPRVRLLRADRQGASFRIGDDLSGVARYRATLNGAWLLMNYDYKTGRLWSEGPNGDTDLRGELTLEVTDQAGNQTLHREQIN